MRVSNDTVMHVEVGDYMQLSYSGTSRLRQAEGDDG